MLVICFFALGYFSCYVYRLAEFNLSSKATWCCAWNTLKYQFSVGIEKSGLLLDVNTRKLWQLYSDSSDVLSQAFSHV